MHNSRVFITFFNLFIFVNAFSQGILENHLLVKAIQDGDSARIEKLVKTRRVLVEMYDSNGWTPLHYACLHNDIKTAKLLIENGADINAISMDSLKYTPSLIAAEGGFVDLLLYLYVKNADLLIKDNNGKTAIDMLEKSNPEYYKLFNSFDLPLVEEIRTCNIKKVKERLERDNSRVNTTDLLGWGPIHFAAEIGSPEITELLLKFGANVNLQTGRELYTPLMLAAYNNWDIVCVMLYRKGADFSIKNAEGKTAFDISNDETLEPSDDEKSTALWGFLQDPDFFYQKYLKNNPRYLLSDEVTDMDMTLQFRHTQSITDLAISNDGKLLASCSEDNTIKIWDVHNGGLIRTLFGHNEYGVNSILFDANNYLLSTGNDKTLRLWDIKTGRNLKTQFLRLGTGLKLTTYPGSDIFVCYGDPEYNNNSFESESLTYGDLKPIVWSDLSFSPDNNSQYHIEKLIYNKDHSGMIMSAILDDSNYNDQPYLFYKDLVNDSILFNISDSNILKFNNIEFSPNNKLALSSASYLDSSEKTFIIDLKTNSILDLIPYQYAVFLDDERLICSNNLSIDIYNVNTRSVESKFQKSVGTIEKLIISPDKKYVFAIIDSSIKSWSLNTHQQIRELGFDLGLQTINADSEYRKQYLERNSNDIKAILKNFSAKPEILFVDIEKKIIVYKEAINDDSDKYFSYLYDRPGKPILLKKSYSFFGDELSDLGPFVVSQDRSLLCAAAGLGEFSVWKISNGNLLFHGGGQNDSYSSFTFSKDNKLLATASFGLMNSALGNARILGLERCIVVWDLKKNSVIGSFWGLTSSIKQLQFDGNILKAFEENGVVHIYDLQTQKQKAILLTDSAGHDAIDYTPDHYYEVRDKHFLDAIRFTIGETSYEFEQFDVKYNRPDVILQQSGSSDTALLMAYRKAYEKRIRRLNIDTAMLNINNNIAPMCNIINTDSIDYDLTENILKLQITALSPVNTISSFNIWINEVPLFGVRGISLKNRNTKHFDTTLTVTLSTGSNRIETSVTNVGGLESYRMPLDVKYTPVNPVKEKLYFVGIGIDQFNDSRYNLSWSVKDIRDLARSFKEKYRNNCVIDTLFNKNVSTEKVTALKHDLLATTENDKVIVAYSGHGLLSKDYDYFLSTYNVNFEEPEKGGLPYESLEDLLDSIPARKKLMLIDACHSGEVDKEEMQKYKRVQDNLKDVGTKGVILLVDSTAKLGTKNSFELMQELFVNVGRSTGATIISAASGTQFSYEKGDLENGVFTYSILELMKQSSTITISGLKQYVDQRVTELTKGMQVPTSRNENKVLDWKVW